MPRRQQPEPTRGTRIRRLAAIGTVAAFAVGASACGDDEESAEDRFCAAGDALEEDVTALASVDVVAGGLDALEEQFDAVGESVSELEDAGTDLAADEIDALEASIDALDEAIDALGGEITTENASGVATAVGDVASAAAAVFDVLTTTCS